MCNKNLVWNFMRHYFYLSNMNQITSILIGSILTYFIAYLHYIVPKDNLLILLYIKLNHWSHISYIISGSAFKNVYNIDAISCLLIFLLYGIIIYKDSIARNYFYIFKKICKLFLAFAEYFYLLFNRYCLLENSLSYFLICGYIINVTLDFKHYFNISIFLINCKIIYTIFWELFLIERKNKKPYFIVFINLPNMLTSSLCIHVNYFCFIICNNG